tara:strand:- start:310 stop:654 length:345 start_codon:yes stop_codon:yes gene_type:complete
MAYDSTDCFGNSYKETLQAYFPKGSTAYTVLRHTSKSGMTRHISVLATSVRSGDGSISNVSYTVAELLKWKHAPRTQTAAIKVGGCGMDMGFHLIYTLSSILYGDGLAIKQRWV